MKGEIKEILDEMYHIICTYSDDYDYFEENKINFELSYKNMEKLYDYITNLQQRNEKAIEYIKEHRRADLVFKLYLTEQETDNVLNILQGGDE